jgi:ribosomal protein L14
MVECIKVLNGSKQAYLGDRIVCVVQRIRTQTAQEQARKQNATVLPKLNRGDVRRAVVVRTKQQAQRKDGSIIRFDDNACILIDDKGEPLGTRIMGNYRSFFSLGVCLDVSGVVARELASRPNATKIMSLAPQVV